MRKIVELKRNITIVALFVFLFGIPIVFSGCASLHIIKLYLTSSLTGNVYTFDMETNTCTTETLFNYNNDAGDRIYFYNNKGYIAAGTSGTLGAVISFDPDAINLTATPFTNFSGSAWDIVFISATKAYVTEYGNWGENDGGVYVFDPSNMNSTFTLISNTEGNPEGVILLASKRKLYVANSAKDTVSVINTSIDKEIKEIDVEDNPTQIVALHDGSKIYVVCSNFFGKSKLVEIITDSDTRGDTFTIAETAQAVSISGTKIYYTGVQDPLGSITDIGPFYIDVSESIPVETAIPTIKAGGGGSLVHNGKLYITQPDWSGGQSTLTAIDLLDHSEISGSPFNVGAAGDGIKGMAVN